MKQSSIVSYSLSGLPQAVKTKISQHVYGKRSKKRVGNKVYDYSYKGLKDEPGSEIIAESAIMLPNPAANDFISILKGEGVAYRLIKIWR